MTRSTWFFIDVKGPDGQVVTWGLELAGPTQLLRQGWRRDTLKVGETVTVEARRARDGSSNANAVSIVVTNTGVKLLGGSPPAN
jgi:hypothetical protein